MIFLFLLLLLLHFFHLHSPVPFDSDHFSFLISLDFLMDYYHFHESLINSKTQKKLRKKGLNSFYVQCMLRLERQASATYSTCQEICAFFKKEKTLKTLLLTLSVSCFV